MTPLDEAIIANDLLPREQQRTNQEIADEFSTSEASPPGSMKKASPSSSQKR